MVIVLADVPARATHRLESDTNNQFCSSMRLLTESQRVDCLLGVFDGRRARHHQSRATVAAYNGKNEEAHRVSRIAAEQVGARVESPTK